MIAAVQDKMRDKKLVIADGHHRYETALNFRNECRAAAGATPNPDAPYEFVMMTFVNMNDPGLLSASDPSRRAFPDFVLRRRFPERQPRAFSKLKKSTPPSTLPTPPRFSANAAAPEPRCLPSPPTALSFALSETSRIAIPAGPLRPPARPRRRATAQVPARRRLKLSEESIRNQQNLSYLRDASEALAQVRKGAANIAFLMNPCPVRRYAT